MMANADCTSVSLEAIVLDPRSDCKVDGISSGRAWLVDMTDCLSESRRWT